MINWIQNWLHLVKIANLAKKKCQYGTKVGNLSQFVKIMANFSQNLQTFINYYKFCLINENLGTKMKI